MTFAHDLWQRVFKVPQDTRRRLRHLYIDTLAMEIVREPKPVRNHRDVPIFLATLLAIWARSLPAAGGLPRPETFTPGKTSLFEPVHALLPILREGVA